MSTLWTPGGEHPVPRPQTGGPATGGGQTGGPGEGPPGGTGGQGTGGQDDLAGQPTPEEIEEAQAEMDAIREQLLQAPVEVVIANHAMGLWELAALHLSQKPPQLAQAQLAIDALSALVEGLGSRLGEGERTLTDGLGQIRMAFVQIANAERARTSAGGATPA